MGLEILHIIFLFSLVVSITLCYTVESVPLIEFSDRNSGFVVKKLKLDRVDGIVRLSVVFRESQQLFTFTAAVVDSTKQNDRR